MKTRALLLALPLLALSCRQNRASVTIQSICYPTDTCTFSAKCDSQLIGTARLDTTVVHTAELFLQVANQLQDNTSKDTGQLNTNGAHVNQITVSYGEIGLPTDTYNVSNMGIPANGTSVISVLAVRGLPQNATIMDDAVAAGGGLATIVAKIKLRGYFDDGSTFETGEFATGLDLCSNCVPLPGCAAGKQACPYDGMEPVGCGSTG